MSRQVNRASKQVQKALGVFYKAQKRINGAVAKLDLAEQKHLNKAEQVKARAEKRVVAHESVIESARTQRSKHENLLTKLDEFLG